MSPKLDIIAFGNHGHCTKAMGRNIPSFESRVYELRVPENVSIWVFRCLGNLREICLPIAATSIRNNLGGFWWYWDEPGKTIPCIEIAAFL